GAGAAGDGLAIGDREGVGAVGQGQAVAAGAEVDLYGGLGGAEGEGVFLAAAGDRLRVRDGQRVAARGGERQAVRAGAEIDGAGPLRRAEGDGVGGGADRAR